MRWCLILMLLFSPVAAKLPVVQDPKSGVAMYGFDPVALFTDKTLTLGIEAFELRWNGVVWRFSGFSNLEAFKKSPETFTPQFSGYDPVQIARGKATVGVPEYWLITENKLYLFHSPTMRAIWQQNKERLLKEAEQRWLFLE